MTCSACGTENAPPRRFCSKCGGPLAVRCPACGFTNGPGDAFCGGCGQRLDAAAPAPAPTAPAPSPAPVAERRQLTVMFCDLVGSTALSGRLDPEDLREHVRAYQAVGAEVVARLGGHIAQYLGDGLLVYFGYPAAHEDDAPRAVRAGLAIVDALADLNARQPAGGVRLGVRVGIHTGLVVVGEVGGGSRREQLALGETPNVAARLQGLAEPDTVVISATTHRLVERFFACRALGSHRLRGTDSSAEVYQALGERRPGSGPGVGGPALTPLVGREREVALVIERWEAAADGMGQVVLLSGEAGIGKTRLTQAVCDRLGARAPVRVEGRCSPYRQHSPMHVVVELLQGLLGFERDDTPEMLLRRLERTLAECGIAPAEDVALLASLLAVPAPPTRAGPAATPQRQRQRTIAIVLEIFRVLAARQPLLVLVEDMHWIDASSLELLTLLGEQAATTRLCLLLTARPDFRPPWPALSHTIQVTLTRLPRQQTEQMILSLAGGKALPGAVLRQVLTGADGVPLFVEEITKMVLESGLLRGRAAAYELAAPLGPLAIPATLHDSLMARLDRLPEARPVAQLAAAIGREFSYELLRAVAGADEGALQRELARLVEAELLYQRGLPPAAHYVFKHALIQEAAYQSLLKSVRQQHHRRIAHVLAERFPEIGELQPELLAHHYTEAGLAAEAIPCWQAAADNAVRRSASAEAIAHFERALGLVGALPDSPARARQELGLLVPLGSVLFGSRGFAAPETERVYARAQVLCDQVGDSPEVFPALWGQWGFSNIQGDLPLAWAIGKRLLAHARRSGEPALLLEAHHARWPTHFFRGEFAAALADCVDGLARYDAEQHRGLAFVYGGHDAGACGLAFEAVIRWVLGSPQQALERGERALALARQLAQPHSEADTQVYVALFHLFRGDLVRARAGAEACQALDAEFGFPQWGGMATVVRGSAMVGLGDADGGLAEMRRGLADWQATGAGLMLPMFLAFVAEAELARGDAEAGLRAVDTGLARVAVHGERACEAELHRLRGELLLSAGGAEAAAEAAFRSALETARAQDARGWELRAASSLARLWQRQGRRGDAQRLLADTTRWFTEGLETRDLGIARDLLSALAAP